jgi:hypothetical protein
MDPKKPNQPPNKSNQARPQATAADEAVATPPPPPQQQVTTPTSLTPDAEIARKIPGVPAPSPPSPQPPPPDPQPVAPPPTTAPPTLSKIESVSSQSASPQSATDQIRPQVNSTQSALQLAEIRDGVVIMNDGSFRSVVMSKSINFDLMSPEERDAVEFAYQGFLNSLYFKIQIFIRSSRVDIRPYLEKLDKIRQGHDNMLLALLMEDYIDYIDSLSEETNIMDKQFYIIIPYYPPITTQAAVKTGKRLFGNLFSAFRQNKNQRIITINESTLNNAKSELANRVQDVISGLQSVGIQSVALDTKELGELFYNAYNPDTATRQQLVDMSQLNAPVVEKGRGQAVNPNLGGEQ